MLNLIVKKYMPVKLRALLKIYSLSKRSGHTFYQDIENYLNRSKTQVSAILKILENDKLIIRETDHRPQKIALSEFGKNLVAQVLQEFKR